MARGALERFEEKYTPEPMSGCWLWVGADNGMGYGIFWWDSNRGYAHRFSYQEKYGKIPEGLSLDHLCRNPRCVNPDHLEAVTHAENVRRGDRNGNQNKTHCPRGHEYTEENTYHIPPTKRNAWGRRDCKECSRRRGREYRMRLKNA